MLSGPSSGNERAFRFSARHAVVPWRRPAAGLGKRLAPKGVEGSAPSSLVSASCSVIKDVGE